MFTDYLQTFYYLIYIYTSGFVSLQLVHVSTHKKYRFYQSLTQIKKRSNCFGNPKQKKNLRRVLLFEVIGIRGQWVNDDTIFLVSRSDTISSKSGIEGRVLSHISISLCVIYVYDVAAHRVRYRLILPSIPLFKEMVSLLLKRKIVSSFTQ